MLTLLKVDRLFRHINRNKLLVIMYHGVCRKDYDPPIWTQLPERIFSDQMEYLLSTYKILSLTHVLSSLQSGQELPERSALITFDDGLRNNYTVAFPVLKKHSIPAAIFLTTDYINTDKVLWVDELFFILQKAIKNGCSLKELGFVDNVYFDIKNINDTYSWAVEKMKRMSAGERNHLMDKIRTKADIDTSDLLEDFGMLTRDHILEMDKSGLVGFGAHTATHQILSNITDDQWRKELKEPRERLSNMLGKEVESFCYPNGNPKTDFNEDHITYLKECGYKCAFTTGETLYSQGGNPYRIGRIPAGNDFTSDKNFFKLSTSGTIDWMKRIRL